VLVERQPHGSIDKRSRTVHTMIVERSPCLNKQVLGSPLLGKAERLQRLAG
jgi:hypothetical protein